MGSLGIQIIEGNLMLRSLIAWYLQQAGHRVHQSAELRQARETYKQYQPTLVILDSDADGDGLQFCRWLHQQQESLILILSARNTETDIVTGLKAGADDYLAKPFGIQEFLARVEALLRRQKSPAPPAMLDYGHLKIDLVQRRVWLKGELIDLTPQEFSLLYALAQVGGLPLSRTELLERAWPEAIDNPRTVDTHILSLRKKVEADPRQPTLIQTVRKVGYRFNQEILNPNSAPKSSLDRKQA
ncbi:MAG: response regulator transcription factor [Hormoscilla sp. GM7CHS1pb]|nr:response regulator transcription factor [Hormoscilla sp. GM7CHS1pb]